MSYGWLTKEERNLLIEKINGTNSCAVRIWPSLGPSVARGHKLPKNTFFINYECLTKNKDNGYILIPTKPMDNLSGRFENKHTKLVNLPERLWRNA